jgi:arylsulfatase A-like enzyme
MEKPNILWICTDQQRFDTLGCYGNPHVSTPNLDRLAEEGVLFERAYCQSTVCTPSRASFLTGRYPRTTRCRQNGQSIPESEVLVTKLFSEAGYACGLSGKMHLSACHPSVCRTTERRIDDGYDMFHWSHDANNSWPTNEYFHWLNEVGVAFETMPHPECGSIQIGMHSEYHHTTWSVNKAINFIESCSTHNRPWLFSLNIFDPHSPFDPPESHLQKYVDLIDTIPLPNYTDGELETKPSFQKIEFHEGLNSRKKYKAAKMSEKDHRYIKAAYWAMIDLIDEQVGRLLDRLRQKGLLENTLVIFMSDHGELLGDHGMYYKGPFFYEPSIRVPLIVSWPGVIPSGRRSKALVELVDLAQTMLDAAGIKHDQGMQGRSLWELLKGNADLNHHRDDVYCEYYNALPWNNPAAYGTMVLTERYKLVPYHGLERGELYDLELDPAETFNRWDHPDYASVQMMLMKKLCDRMAWTIDPLPERQAPW